MDRTPYQPPLNLTVQTGGGGAGNSLGGRIIAAIVASSLSSGMGYLLTYSSYGMAAWLSAHGWSVGHPAAKKTAASIAGRVKEVAGKVNGGIDERIARLKQSAKATKETIENKVKEKKEAFHKAREEKKKVQDEKRLALEEKRLALQQEQAEREKEAAKRAALYNAQCPHCHAPLRISDRLKHERVRCAKCQSIFGGGAARSLGPPSVRAPRRPLFGSLR